MTDLRQAAQQALEALGYTTDPDHPHYEDQLAAITALKAALEQQAEPVAYFDFQEFKFTWAKHMKIGPVPVSIKVEPLKLYSEAAQRQWVGLTDEDLEFWTGELGQGELGRGVIRAVANHLKERNND